MPITEHEVNGKRIWMIDDQLLDSIGVMVACDFCVDASALGCPTARQIQGGRNKPCDIMLFDEEGYAKVLAKRMEGL